MLEAIVKRWNASTPPCVDKEGNINPIIYPSNPTMICPHYFYCDYQKEQQKEIICTYQASLSIMQELVK
jgi:hypothetical protein